MCLICNTSKNEDDNSPGWYPISFPSGNRRKHASFEGQVLRKGGVRGNHKFSIRMMIVRLRQRPGITMSPKSMNCGKRSKRWECQWTRAAGHVMIIRPEIIEGDLLLFLLFCKYMYTAVFPRVFFFPQLSKVAIKAGIAHQQGRFCHSNCRPFLWGGARNRESLTP